MKEYSLQDDIYIKKSPNSCRINEQICNYISGLMSHQGHSIKLERYREDNSCLMNMHVGYKHCNYLKATS